jgi:hypothetical protein
MTICLSVCLSVCTEQVDSYNKDFHEIWFFNILRKYVEKIKFWLKSGKNNGYFAWPLMYIYDNISLNFS